MSRSDTQCSALRQTNSAIVQSKDPRFDGWLSPRGCLPGFCAGKACNYFSRVRHYHWTIGVMVDLPTLASRS
jgi:hypothetical protein